MKSLSLKGIKEIGNFTQQQIQLEYSNPKRTYDLKSTVNEIIVNIGDTELKIYSYGHFAKIVDYKSIAEKLLNNDLLDFEKSIKNAAFNLFKFNNKIAESTKILLSSEVNYNIDNSEFVENSSISHEYQQRVKSGLSSAMEYLIYSLSGYSFFSMLLFTIISLLGLDYFFELDFIYDALISLVFGILIYFSIEILNKDKIMRNLGDEYNEPFRDKIYNYIEENKSFGIIRSINIRILILVIVVVYIIKFGFE